MYIELLIPLKIFLKLTQEEIILTTNLTFITLKMAEESKALHNSKSLSHKFQ